ncbi:MAG TPA: hypothetical protein DCG12_11215 [Planctomycetaceae bacterium]|nr:hypothetical protein [Planctomycetaceae bacterium]|tara:strand:- start:232 stop:1563 length:1332 start_codon:yes stop_codon:yes gene_type:complete
MSEYQDAIRWVFNRINYECTRPQINEHFRLERVEQLLELIDAPQNRIPAVHIAGTKGKGSTAAMIDSILRAAGIRTGLFTSPHIETFEERMKVSGQMPDPQTLTSLVGELRQRLSTASDELIDAGVTYFEVATLLAWMYFDQMDAELVVLETGLGGRLDCTNVCRPLVTVVTTIGMDHMHILGDTIEKIAAEKAGIIKAAVPVVSAAGSGEATDVVAMFARNLQCEHLRLGNEYQLQIHGEEFSVGTPSGTYDHLKIGLSGDHQKQNAAAAVATTEILARRDSRITPEAIASGLRDTACRLRFEMKRGAPTVILDVAHNPDSIKAFIGTLQQEFPGEASRVLVFGSSKDKNAEGMLKEFGDVFSLCVFTEFQNNPRATPREELKDLYTSLTDGAPCSTADSIAEALDIATQAAGPSGTVSVTGSFFLAAEALQVINRRSEPSS